MKKIVIFGGTGFIGMSLADHLKSNGFTPVLVARNKPKGELKHPFVQWDAVQLGDWVKELEGAHAIVNLTGKTVDCIKTPDNCDLILRSRVDSTTAIGRAWHEVEHAPKIWIQMSTAHIYGDPPHQVCDESSSTGYGLAPIVGKAWEEAFLNSLPEGVRGVRLRTSFVIGKGGGALESLKNIVKLGLGGTAGSGTQGMSWIHEYDMNHIILTAITDAKYDGFYIVSAPNPVSNKVFMRQLRKEMKFPFGLPSPAFMIRFGAHNFFKTDPELVLYGRYVVPKRLIENGYTFKFPELKGALTDLLK